MGEINRRDFLKFTLAAPASSLLPNDVFGQKLPDQGGSRGTKESVALKLANVLAIPERKAWGFIGMTRGSVTIENI